MPTKTMTATRENLLQAILENPDNDHLRLVYADWLEEQGELDRAEFIRVQCEIAALGEKLVVDAVRGDFPRLDDLRRREQELYTTSAAWLLPTLADYIVGVVIDAAEFEIAAATDGDIVGFLHRGFIERITCTAEDWLKHGDAILSEHPVQQVNITKWDCSIKIKDTFDVFPELKQFLEEGAEYFMPTAGQYIQHRWKHIIFRWPEDSSLHLVQG